MQKLLIDLGSSLKLSLLENTGGSLTARGEFGRAGVPTQNNRRYPKSIWDREIQKIQEAIRAGKVMGELDHPCLTDDNFQILTIDGWKPFANVKVGDKVWSLKDGVAVESFVEEIINEEYSGVAYSVKGRSIQSSFTAPHKVVLAARSDRLSSAEIYATIDFIANNREKFAHNPIPKTADFSRKKSDFVIIPASAEANSNRTKNDVSKDLVLEAKVFAAFMGIYLAEGGTSPESSDNWNIQISQKNEWSKKYIFEEILSAFPADLEWKETETGFHLADARLYRYLKNLGDQYNRYVPKEVKSLDADCLREFIFWFSIGDGRIVAANSDVRSSYANDKTVKESVAVAVRDGDVPSQIRQDVFSVSEKLIRDIHECLVLSGGSGTLSVIEPDKDYEYAGRIVKAENKVPLYQLHISTARGIYLSKSVEIEKFDHSGKIYCLKTTHGNFYMEQNGKSFWTGNCDGKTSLKRVSHLITGLTMTDDGVIVGEAKILRNQWGDQLRSILEVQGAVGVSSRGMGSTAPSDDGMEDVQEDYQYMTHDFVADPAVLTSYPKFTTEVRWIEPSKVVQETQAKEGNVMAEKVDAKVLPQSEPTEVKDAEVKVEVVKDEESKAVTETPAVEANAKANVKAEDVQVEKKDKEEEVPAEEPKDEEPKEEEPKKEEEETKEVKLSHKDIELVKKALGAFVSDEIDPDKLAKVMDKFQDAKKGELEVAKEPKEEPKEEPKAEEPKLDEPMAEVPAEMPPMDIPMDIPMEAIEMAAAKIILGDLKKIMKPLIMPEDVQKALDEKDAQIKKLSEDMEKVGKVANRLGAVLHVERAMTKQPALAEFVSGKFESVQDAEKALTEARKKAGVKKLEEDKRNAELKQVQEQYEARIKVLDAKTKTLEEALDKSIKTIRGTGLKLYVEERTRNHPNALEIRKLCEGKTSKADVDAIVEQHRVAPASNGEYTAIRRRLERMQNTQLVEEHIKESGVKKASTQGVGSVDEEMSELFADANQVKALM